MSNNAIYLGALFAVAMIMLLWSLFQKGDPTTEEDVNEATSTLEREIHLAEELVGARAPHSAECREKLEKARECLDFDNNSTRDIVTFGMLLEQRNRGIKIARDLIALMSALKPTI